MPTPPAASPPPAPRLIHVTPKTTTAAPRSLCFLQRPTAPDLHPHELLPALHLRLDTPEQTRQSPFLHTLLLAPFWLDPTLAYLDPDAWLRLEVTCHRLRRAVPEAKGAWKGLDLGAPWAHASARRKRGEVVARRAALVRVRRAWEAIEAFALPGLKWTLNAGLTETEIRTLEVGVR